MRENAQQRRIKPRLLPMPSAITDAASGRARISPKKRDSAVRLLHHAEQRTPGLVLRLLGGGLRFAGSAPQHFVAQCPKVGTVNSFELHPHVEDDDREQLSRLTAVALVENPAALLERF